MVANVNLFWASSQLFYYTFKNAPKRTLFLEPSVVSTTDTSSVAEEEERILKLKIFKIVRT